MITFLAIVVVVYTAAAIVFWIRRDTFDGSTPMRTRGVRLYGIAFCIAAAVLSLAALAAGAGS
jgi:hypothetical protein